MKRQWITAGGQVVLAGLVAWFVWNSLADNWAEFRTLRVPWEVHPFLLMVAGATVLATFVLLIAAWRLVLSGWGETLPMTTAAWIWTVSNLGRYLPGKVWSVAGLAVLAKREGVAAWASTASALAMQALAVGTGTLVAATTIADRIPPAVLGAAIVAAFGSVAVVTVPALVRRLDRWTSGRFELRPLPVPAAVGGALAATTAWLAYGIAFWALGRGLIADPPSLALATGSFAAGYIVGLLSIFTPGGLGVREAVLVGFLAPSVGSGPAVAVSVGSRLLLTAMELVAAAIAAGIRTTARRRQGENA